jgi:hypothetical protein
MADRQHDLLLLQECSTKGNNMIEKELQMITAEVGKLKLGDDPPPPPPAIVLSPLTLGDITVGTTCNQIITATGGTPPLTLAVSTATPLAGFAVTTDGVLTITVSGVPLATGQLAFTVTPSDVNGPQAAVNFTVNAVPLPVVNPFPPAPPPPPIPALEVRSQAILSDWLAVVTAVKTAYLSLQSDTANDPNYTYAQITAALGDNAPNMQVAAVVIKKLINLLFPGTIVDTVPDCQIILPGS